LDKVTSGLGLDKVTQLVNAGDLDLKELKDKLQLGDLSGKLNLDDLTKLDGILSGLTDGISKDEGSDLKALIDGLPLDGLTGDSTGKLDLGSATDKLDITSFLSGLGSAQCVDLKELTDKLELGGLFDKLDITKSVSAGQCLSLDQLTGKFDLGGIFDKLKITQFITDVSDDKELDLGGLTNQLELGGFLNKLDITKFMSEVCNGQSFDFLGFADKLGLSDLLTKVDFTQYFSGVCNGQAFDLKELMDKRNVSGLISGVIKGQDLGLGGLTGGLKLDSVTDQLDMKAITGFMKDANLMSDRLQFLLKGLPSQAKGANVEGILADVKGQASAILAKVQGIADGAKSGLDLSSSLSGLDILSYKIDVAMKQVKSLANDGIGAAKTKEISKMLTDSLSLIKQLKV